MTVRYANGGTGDRPMSITINGVVQSIAFASTVPAVSPARTRFEGPLPPELADEIAALLARKQVIACDLVCEGSSGLKMR